MSSAKVRAWFKQRTAELTGRNFSPKETRRLLLAAVRRGLQRHPLDLRGSRRALEAAQIFLELDSDKKVFPPLRYFHLHHPPGQEGVDFLDTSVTIGKADKMLEDGGEAGTGLPAFVCPTMPCQWLATAVLRFDFHHPFNLLPPSFSPTFHPPSTLLFTLLSPSFHPSFHPLPSSSLLLQSLFSCPGWPA